MVIKTKLEHPKAKLPEFQHSTDAGADLYAARIIKKGLFSIWYGLGFRTQIPRGYYVMIVPRSSITEKGLTLANNLGIVDSNFRDEWQVRFNYTLKGLFTRNKYKVGDRIAQAILCRKQDTEFREGKRLTKTKRGGGFGSTN